LKTKQNFNIVRIIKIEGIVERQQETTVTYSHKKRVMKNEAPSILTLFKIKRYSVNC
jgi:hypothetical protein